MHVYVLSASLPPTCLPVRDLANPKRSSPCIVTAAAQFSDDRSGYSTGRSYPLRHRRTHHATHSPQRRAEEEKKEGGTGGLPPSTPPQSTPEMPDTKFLQLFTQKACQVGLVPHLIPGKSKVNLISYSYNKLINLLFWYLSLRKQHKLFYKFTIGVINI